MSGSHGVFEVLQKHPNGLAAKDVLQQVTAIVRATPFEDTGYPNQPGVRRFEKIIRFSTIAPVKAGWLVKTKGTWTATDEGLAAFANAGSDVESWFRAAEAKYREWEKGHLVWHWFAGSASQGGFAVAIRITGDSMTLETAVPGRQAGTDATGACGDDDGLAGPGAAAPGSLMCGQAGLVIAGLRGDPDGSPGPDYDVLDRGHVAAGGRRGLVGRAADLPRAYVRRVPVPPVMRRGDRLEYAMVVGCLVQQLSQGLDLGHLRRAVAAGTGAGHADLHRLPPWHGLVPGPPFAPVKSLVAQARAFPGVVRR
jgi:hypothetical protein